MTRVLTLDLDFHILHETMATNMALANTIEDKAMGEDPDRERPDPKFLMIALGSVMRGFVGAGLYTQEEILEILHELHRNMSAPEGPKRKS